jgi:hypothetical protein
MDKGWAANIGQARKAKEHNNLELDNIKKTAKRDYS